MDLRVVVRLNNNLLPEVERQVSQKGGACTVRKYVVVLRLDCGGSRATQILRRLQRDALLKVHVADVLRLFA